MPWVARGARLIYVPKFSSHVCVSDRGAMQRGGIVSPSLQTSAHFSRQSCLILKRCVLASLPTRQQQENTELSVTCKARSWLTKPRGGPSSPRCLWLKVLESEWERQSGLAVSIAVKKELRQDTLLNSSYRVAVVIKEEHS